MRARPDAFPPSGDSGACAASGTADVRLDAGRTLRLPVVAGTVLVARAGRLRVAGPSRWLAERMVVVEQDLAEGQAHVVDGAGWVEVSAVGAAHAWLRRIDPAPATGPAWTWPRFLAPRRAGSAAAR
ncbi:hypothetical protein NF681_05765 [Comamonadaceae bacterium OTU4NAUVB1]|nr:hypothetical protein NF681_05765 [Comamonadaceae bacterium OTU4NAUVB1]